MHQSFDIEFNVHWDNVIDGDSAWLQRIADDWVFPWLPAVGDMVALGPGLVEYKLAQRRFTSYDCVQLHFNVKGPINKGNPEDLIAAGYEEV